MPPQKYFFDDSAGFQPDPSNSTLTHKAMYSTTLPFLGGRLRENELEYCV